MFYTSTRKNNISVASTNNVSVSCKKTISVASIIAETQPNERRHTGRKLFELARRLKGRSEFRGDVEQVRSVVADWHGKARPIIGGDFGATWESFRGAWQRVLCPDMGAAPLDVAFSLAMSEPLPPEAERYRVAGIRLLVALCYQLQQMTGKEPFFLGCRDAGRLLGADFKTAARWLRKLNDDAVIFVVSKGGPKNNKATRYRFRNRLIPRY